MTKATTKQKTPERRERAKQMQRLGRLAFAATVWTPEDPRYRSIGVDFEAPEADRGGHTVWLKPQPTKGVAEVLQRAVAMVCGKAAAELEDDETRVEILRGVDRCDGTRNAPLAQSILCKEVWLDGQFVWVNVCAAKSKKDIARLQFLP